MEGGRGFISPSSEHISNIIGRGAGGMEGGRGFISQFFHFLSTLSLFACFDGGEGMKTKFKIHPC